MTANGSNKHNVSYSQICFLSRLLETHKNITQCQRSYDIIFSVNRKNPNDSLNILCLSEYVMGMDKMMEVLDEFATININIIYIGGAWNKYSTDAKTFCVQHQIGLFVTDEMTGALFRDDYWNYHKKDKDGNPKYFGDSPEC